MKNIKKYILLLFVIMFTRISLFAQSNLFTEDFTGQSGTVLTSAGWIISGTIVTSPLTITSPGLTSNNFPGSGVGNSVTLVSTGQDVYKSFNSVSQGSVYFSMMMNVGTAGTGDYFVALSPSIAQTNYYGRLHLKSSGSGFNIGISKSNEVSGGAQYGPTVFSLNSTYLVVLKYTFTGATADSTNDPISVYVLSSTVPVIEPTTPEINAYATSTKSDATNLGFVTIRQGTTGAAPGLILDGIRVGTSWASILTSVKNLNNGIPQKFELENNFPNPFNPSTTIKFGIPEAGKVTLKIYDAIGKEVATLTENKLEAGNYQYNWNATGLTSGMYFYKLVSVSTNGNTKHNISQVKKMILLK